jgi:DNA-binding GntR family transcriptional regulator
MVLWQTPTSSQIVEKLARRLKFSLRILTPEELWDHFPPRFLLWVLVVASIASAGHADRAWLLQTLKQLREKLAFENWEAAKATLVEFAWVDHICARPAILIWKELDSVEL